MSDLDAEFAAASRGAEAALRLAPQLEGIIGALPITLARSGEYFEPADDGTMAMILAVRVDDPNCPETGDPAGTVRFGDIVDLIAVHPAYPRRWALRRGTATWVGAYGPQLFSPPAVPVWRTPLAWPRHGCRGICILAREPRTAQAILLGCRSIAPEDYEHGRELRRVMERPYATPSIVTPTAPRRRVAA